MHNISRLGWLLAVAAVLLALALPAEAESQLTADLDKVVAPFAADGSFSGAILVTRDGNVVYDKAYGFANSEERLPNLSTTSFHIGSLSRQYTAAVILMLADSKRLWLDNTVSQLIPGVAGGDKVTVRNLLAENPAELGGHSAYNLLARIVEANTGEPFGDIAKHDFFGPLWLDGSGIDNDDVVEPRRLAKGYERDPNGELKLSAAPHWSEHLGDGSAYATTRDELRWFNAFFSDRLVTASSRQLMLDSGFGGFNFDALRFGQPAYWLTSHGHGFSAFVARLPAHDDTVIIFGNADTQASEQIGTAMTAIASRER